MRAMMSERAVRAEVEWFGPERCAVAAEREVRRILAEVEPYHGGPCLDCAGSVPHAGRTGYRYRTLAELSGYDSRQALADSLAAFVEAQPEFADCGNCGSADHRQYTCPCGCHGESGK